MILVPEFRVPKRRRKVEVFHRLDGASTEVEVKVQRRRAWNGGDVNLTEAGWYPLIRKTPGFFDVEKTGFEMEIYS